jgi:hypothetical protein
VFIQSFEVGDLKEMRGLTTARIVRLLASSGQPFDFVAMAPQAAATPTDHPPDCVSELLCQRHWTENKNMVDSSRRVLGHANCAGGQPGPQT